MKCSRLSRKRIKNISRSDDSSFKDDRKKEIKVFKQKLENKHNSGVILYGDKGCGKSTIVKETLLEIINEKKEGDKNSSSIIKRPKKLGFFEINMQHVSKDDLRKVRLIPYLDTLGKSLLFLGTLSGNLPRFITSMTTLLTTYIVLALSIVARSGATVPDFTIVWAPALAQIGLVSIIIIIAWIYKYVKLKNANYYILISNLNYMKNYEEAISFIWRLNSLYSINEDNVKLIFEDLQNVDRSIAAKFKTDIMLISSNLSNNKLLSESLKKIELLVKNNTNNEKLVKNFKILQDECEWETTNGISFIKLFSYQKLQQTLAHFYDAFEEFNGELHLYDYLFMSYVYYEKPDLVSVLEEQAFNFEVKWREGKPFEPKKNVALELACKEWLKKELLKQFYSKNLKTALLNIISKIDGTHFQEDKTTIKPTNINMYSVFFINYTNRYKFAFA